MGRSPLAHGLGSLLLVLALGMLAVPTAKGQCFTTATNFGVGSAPYSVAVGDFNADGRPDLAVANSGSGNVSVLLGQGSGSFGAATNFAVGDRPFYVVVGDFNADGKPDLAVANYFSNNVSVLLGQGNGSFATATNFAVGNNPASVAVGDFNADGKPDLAVVNQTSNNVSVLLGQGNGSFAAATNFSVGLNPYWVAVGDFNGDGKLDLAVANNSSGSVSVLLGQGNGSFSAATSFAVGSFPRSVAVGDFNSDGKLDLAFVIASGNASILLGQGDGSFGTATNFGVGVSPVLVTVGDFNADGKPDLATANSNSNNVSVLLGQGNGSFAAATNFAVDSGPYSVAVGDFNADGKPDLATANISSSNVSVLTNTTTLVSVVSQPPSSSAVCVGSPVSAPVSVSGTATSYQWYKDGAVLASQTSATLTLPNAQTTDQGSYSLVVTGACYSLTSSAFSLTVSTPPSVSLTNNGPLTCSQPSATLSATPGAATYQFAPGASQQGGSAGNTATVATPGIYSLTALSSNGCSALASTTVTSDTDPPSANISPSSAILTCATPSVSLTATGTGTYRWEDNSSNAVRTVSSPGTYSVTVTGSNGCTATASTTVSSNTELTPPTLLASATSSVNQPISVTASGCSGTLNWNLQGGTGSAAGAVYTLSAVGSYTLAASCTLNSCTSPASSPISLTILAPAAVSGTKTVLGEFTPGSIVTYTLTLNNTGAATQNDNPGDELTDTLPASLSLLSASATSGSVQPTPTTNTITWNGSLVPGGSVSITITARILTGTAGQTVSNQARIAYDSDGNNTNDASAKTDDPGVGGSADATSFVVGCPPLSVSLGQNGPLTCTQTSVTLTASPGGDTYQFSAGASQQGSSSANAATVSSPGVYTVTLITSSGCSATASTTVSSNTDLTPPTLRASATSSVNQPISVTASGCSGTLNWNLQGGTGSATGTVYTLSAVGSYTLAASCTLNSCTSPASSPISLTILAPSPTFAITGVNLISCQPTPNGQRMITFNPVYSGLTGEKIVLAIAYDNFISLQPGPYTLTVPTTQPILTLIAQQGGKTAFFNYRWLEACQTGPSNQPPTTTGIPPQNALKGQAYTLSLTTYFADPQAQPLSFQSSPLPAGLSRTGGVISGVPSMTGSFPLSVTASDPQGQWVSSSFVLTITDPTQPNRAPTTTGIGSRTVVVGQPFSLGLPPYFADPDGESLVYRVAGLPATLSLTGGVISGVPSTTGSYPVSVTAVDPGGLFVVTGFGLTVRSTTPVTQPFALVSVSTQGCQNLGGTQRRVTFLPQYTGLTGEGIVLAMTNGYITSQAGPYSQVLSTDQPLLTLIARQGSVTSVYNYNWVSACSGGGRVGAVDAGDGLQVLVLGNPVESDQVALQIRGISGSWVAIVLLDTQGKTHHQQRLDNPNPVEQLRVDLPAGKGLQLIQVHTPTQHQTVKVIRN